MLAYLKHHWKSIAYTVLILYLSFAPSSDFNKFPPIQILNFDKFVHLIMYSLLAVILIVDYRSRYSTKNKQFLFIIFLFCVIFGGIIELMQEKWFYPRSAEWIDWLADILGALLGIFFMYIFKQIHLRS